MSRALGARLIDRLAATVGAALIGVTVATLAARGSWFFELFCHFRWQYVLVAVVTVPILWKFGRRWLAAICLAALLLHAYTLSVQRFASAVGPPRAGWPLRIVSLNVRYSNRNYAALIDFIRQAAPDILCLYETTATWQAHLAPLAHDFAFALFTGDGPHSGIACLSRRQPLRVVPPGGEDLASPWMRLDYEVGGEPVTVYGAHLYLPVTAAGAARRDRQLRNFARELGGVARPVIVVGDFNLTPYSPYDRDFTRASGLRDCSRGRPLSPTWPVGFLPFWIQIDRCFVSQGAGIARYSVGRALGSDHYPLIVDLLIGAAGGTTAARTLSARTGSILRPRGQGFGDRQHE